MARRIKFTQADLVRAIRAAKAEGQIAIQTPAGIAFVNPAQISPTPSPESAIDDWFRQNGND